MRKRKILNNKNDHVSRNIRVTVAYDGSRYLGWQRLGGMQNSKTIQGILETSISDLLKEDIVIIGAGRTDTGVHAIGQTANFYTLSQLSSNEIKDKLNKKLPDDIKVYKVEDVCHSFHSRYDAIEKTYEYHLAIQERPSVFERKYSVPVPYCVDLEQMRAAAEAFLGTHDFRVFSGPISKEKDSIRTIDRIEMKQTDFRLTISITGNGFLYHMVRIMVGTLVEAGEGKCDRNDIEKFFVMGVRKNAGMVMPAKGLMLAHVGYQNVGKV